MAPLPTTLTSMRSDTSTTITVAYAALESSLNPTVWTHLDSSNEMLLTTRPSDISASRVSTVTFPSPSSRRKDSAPGRSTSPPWGFMPFIARISPHMTSAFSGTGSVIPRRSSP